MRSAPCWTGTSRIGTARIERPVTEPAASKERSAGARLSRRQLLARAASITITVVLLADLVGRVNWAEFDQMLGRVGPASWIGALLAYLALNLLRALRFRILLDKRDSPWRILIPITLYHNFLVRALPFKLGELSYIVLLRSRLNYTMEEGFSSLFGARVLELLDYRHGFRLERAGQRRRAGGAAR